MVKSDSTHAQWTPSVKVEKGLDGLKANRLESLQLKFALKIEHFRYELQFTYELNYIE